MADFVAPPSPITPDILGSYLRGQMGGYQVQGAQQQLQAGDQDLTKGALNIQQLQLALKNQQAVSQYATQRLGQMQGQGAPQAQGAQAQGGPTGSIQNGPQASQGADWGGAGAYSSGPNFDPQTQSAIAMLTGGDPVKAAKDASDYNLEQRKLQASGPLDTFDSISNSASPARTVMANPSLMAKWPQVAMQLGLDPVRDFNDANVRRGLQFAANNIRGSVGIPAKDYDHPIQNTNLGQGEVAQIDQVTGKKVGDLVDRQTPGYSLVDKFNIADGTTTKVPVQTSGYGMGGVSPVTGGAVGPQGTPQGFNTGVAKPTDPELKAAMFGSEMRPAMQTLSSMEAKGFNLSPSTRALLIHAATSEDAGAISQLIGQEALAHGVNKQEQTYIAALMPMLQAAGHDQSGARLSTGQVRQNIESLLPIDTSNKAAMDQVNKNRQGFYTGLLTQAGSATQLPQYKNTLGADLKSAQGAGSIQTATPEQARALPSGTKFRTTDGRILVKH